MATSISSKKLKHIIESEIKDPELKRRFRKLSSANLDTLVREAGVVLEDRIRNATGLSEDGVRLVDAAFGSGDKALKFSQHPGEQEGIKMLYRGAMQYIRNPPMHKLIDYRIDTATVLLRVMDSLLTLLPSSTGKKTAGRGKWEQQRFFERLKEYVDADTLDKTSDLYRWSEKTAHEVSFGTGTHTGSFSFQFRAGERSIRVFTIFTNGKLEIPLKWIGKRVDKRSATQFRDQLKLIPSLSHVTSDAGRSRSLSVGSVLRTESEIRAFKEAVLGLQESLISKPTHPSQTEKDFDIADMGDNAVAQSSSNDNAAPQPTISEEDVIHEPMLYDFYRTEIRPHLIKVGAVYTTKTPDIRVAIHGRRKASVFALIRRRKGSLEFSIRLGRGKVNHPNLKYDKSSPDMAKYTLRPSEGIPSELDEWLKMARDFTIQM